MVWMPIKGVHMCSARTGYILHISQSSSTALNRGVWFRSLRIRALGFYQILYLPVIYSDNHGSDAIEFDSDCSTGSYLEFSQWTFRRWWSVHCLLLALATSHLHHHLHALVFFYELVRLFRLGKYRLWMSRSLIKTMSTGLPCDVGVENEFTKHPKTQLPEPSCLPIYHPRNPQRSGRSFMNFGLLWAASRLTVAQLPPRVTHHWIRLLASLSLVAFLPRPVTPFINI